MISKKSQFVAIALTAAACWAHPSAATVVPVLATADSFLSAARPDGNFGGGGGVSIAAPGSPNGEFQSVVRFNLASVKSSFDAEFGAGLWSIQSVSLKLVATSPNNPAFNPTQAGQFAVQWMENDGWTEGTGSPSGPTTDGITFNTLPSFLGSSDAPLGTFAFDGSTSGARNYALGSAAGMTSDIFAGGSLSLRLLAADSQVSYLFFSRNQGPTANRPELSITAVPEPGVAGLLVVGALVCHRRRFGSRSR